MTAPMAANVVLTANETRRTTIERHASRVWGAVGAPTTGAIDPWGVVVSIDMRVAGHDSWELSWNHRKNDARTSCSMLPPQRPPSVLFAPYPVARREMMLRTARAARVGLVGAAVVLLASACAGSDAAVTTAGAPATATPPTTAPPAPATTTATTAPAA